MLILGPKRSLKEPDHKNKELLGSFIEQAHHPSKGLLGLLRKDSFASHSCHGVSGVFLPSR